MDQLTQLVDVAFDGDGGLSSLLPGYHPNSLQIEYAQRVAETLQAGESGSKTSLTLLEGETGIGKSLAYLIPLTLYLAETGRRGLVSTYTLQLQNQLMREGGDLQLALAVTEQLTGQQLSAGIRKGMRNYVSLERVVRVVEREQRRASLESGQQLDSFLQWAESSVSGDLQEWMEQAGGLPQGVEAAEICLSPLDRGEVVQRYRRDVERSRSVDLLLVTHAMLVRHARQWFNHLGDEENPVELLVVDEADRLGQAEESLYTRSMDLNEVVGWVVEEEGGAGVVEQCRTILAQLSRLRDRGGRFLDLQRISSVEQSRLLDGLDLLYHSLFQLIRAGSTPFLLQEYLHEQLTDIRELVGVLRKEVGFGAQGRLAVVDYRGGAVLRLLPLSVGNLLSRLWRRQGGRGLRSCLITSATLAGGGKQQEDAEALCRSIGLVSAGAQLNQSVSGTLVPKQFGVAHYRLPDPRVVLPDQGALSIDHVWVRYVVEMIIQARQSGRVLVLTTSFQDTRVIAECCHGHGVEAVGHQRGVKLDTLLSGFVAQEDAVLISPVAWEGVDLPGMVDHLLVAKLPFVPPESPYLLAQEVHFRSSGKSRKVLKRIQFEYQLSQALRKFRQGLGRGIRRHDDSVTVWIADGRFPVPDEKLRAAGLCVEKRTTHRAFVRCIPERFRGGPMSSWARARLFLGCSPAREV